MKGPRGMMPAEDPMSTEFVTLRNAGYRERVFVKAHLASADLLHHWPGVLDAWSYDASLDEILTGERLGNARYKVALEPGESEKELAEHGLNGKDCLGVPENLPSVKALAEELHKRIAVLEDRPNDDDGWERAKEIVTAYLEELRAGALEVPVIEEGRPGSPVAFKVRLPWYPETPSLRVNVIIPATERELDYLDDIASAYFAAPEHTEEEELLERAHTLACRRLNVNQDKHLEQVTALQKVKEARPTRLLQLASALAITLGDKSEEWLDAAPWRDGDIEPEDFFAELAMRVCVEAEGVLGLTGAMPGMDEEILERFVKAQTIMIGADVDDFTAEVLGVRIAAALAMVRTSGRAAEIRETSEEIPEDEADPV